MAPAQIKRAGHGPALVYSMEGVVQTTDPLTSDITITSFLSARGERDYRVLAPDCNARRAFSVAERLVDHPFERSACAQPVQVFDEPVDVARGAILTRAGRVRRHHDVRQTPQRTIRRQRL